jgi:hypothetical protein
MQALSGEKLKKRSPVRYINQKNKQEEHPTAMTGLRAEIRILRL